MNECCGTCNYFCEVRKHPAYEEILTHICALFLWKKMKVIFLKQLKMMFANAI